MVRIDVKTGYVKVDRLPKSAPWAQGVSYPFPVTIDDGKLAKVDGKYLVILWDAADGKLYLCECDDFKDFNTYRVRAEIVLSVGGQEVVDYPVSANIVGYDVYWFVSYNDNGYIVKTSYKVLYESKIVLNLDNAYSLQNVMSPIYAGHVIKYGDYFYIAVHGSTGLLKLFRTVDFNTFEDLWAGLTSLNYRYHPKLLRVKYNSEPVILVTYLQIVDTTMTYYAEIYDLNRNVKASVDVTSLNPTTTGWFTLPESNKSIVDTDSGLVVTELITHPGTYVGEFTKPWWDQIIDMFNQLVSILMQLLPIILLITVILSAIALAT